MDQKAFTKVVNSQIKLCTNTLVNKAQEYGPVDRLGNFKKSANMQSCSVKSALGGMMIKHTTSIYDMIDSDSDYTLEIWDEKITDHINYLLLLKAVIVEDKQVKNP